MSNNTPAQVVPYTKLERIGKGSFGSVFKGIHNETGQIVAIKVLDLDSSEDEFEEIQKEINVLINCDSEYITRYHSSYLVQTNLWIVMDYAYTSIRQILKSGSLTERQVGVISKDVVQALVYLHKAGIIHRDIKAANVLITEQGGIKLCDFGVAGQVTMNCLRRNSFVGTPYWMSPEVIKRSTYDFKADIWSLGITVYEMITGNPPYADQDPMKAIFLIPRNPPARLEGSQYSKNIKEFIALCLNDDPQTRSTADELLKSTFLKNIKKKGSELTELITRHQQWKTSKEEADSDDEDVNAFELEENLDNGRMDSWVFDTARLSKAIDPKSVLQVENAETVRHAPVQNEENQTDENFETIRGHIRLKEEPENTPNPPSPIIVISEVKPIEEEEKDDNEKVNALPEENAKVETPDQTVVSEQKVVSDNRDSVAPSESKEEEDSASSTLLTNPVVQKFDPATMVTHAQFKPPRLDKIGFSNDALLQEFTRVLEEGLKWTESLEQVIKANVKR